MTKEEIRSILRGLLNYYEVNPVRVTGIMVIIAVCEVEEEMADFVASYYGKEDTFTIQAFMSKLDEVTKDFQIEEDEEDEED